MNNNLPKDGPLMTALGIGRTTNSVQLYTFALLCAAYCGHNKMFETLAFKATIGWDGELRFLDERTRPLDVDTTTRQKALDVAMQNRHFKLLHHFTGSPMGANLKFESAFVAAVLAGEDKVLLDLITCRPQQFIALRRKLAKLVPERAAEAIKLLLSDDKAENLVTEIESAKMLESLTKGDKSASTP